MSGMFMQIHLPNELGRILGIFIKGKGSYKGTVKKTYKIKPKTITASNCVADWGDNFYSGKKVNPKTSDTYFIYKSGKIQYDIPTDQYKVVAAPVGNGINTGKHTASVKAKFYGDFAGTATVKGPYYIYPTKMKVTSVTAGVAGSGTINVKWTMPKGNFDNFKVIAYPQPYKNGYYYDNVDKTKTSFTMTDIPKGKYLVDVFPVMKASPYMDHECPTYYRDIYVTVK